MEEEKIVIPGEAVAETSAPTQVVPAVEEDVVDTPATIEPTATDEFEVEPTAADEVEPTATDVVEPTATDVIEPTAENVVEPTATDVVEPTATDVVEPTATDVIEPTATDVIEPTAENVVEPTATDVVEPTAENVVEPTAENVVEPTAENVVEPAAEVLDVEPSPPTAAEAPTVEPTVTIAETSEPAEVPTAEPSATTTAPTAEDSPDDTPEEQEQVDDAVLSSLSREDIVKKLQDFASEKQLKPHSNIISQLKIRYRELTAEVRQQAFNRYSEIEEEKGEFVFEDDTEKSFREVNNHIKNILKKEREDLEKLMEENLVRKKALLEELRTLVDSDIPLKNMYDAFKELSEKWKNIHPVSRLVNNDLWSNYQFLTDRFFDKVKMNVELRNLDYKKNLEEKIKLCEEAEALLLEENINRASNALHRLHDRWKETGPVAPEKRDEIWDRFKAASDVIGSRRKQAEELLSEEQKQNLLAKQALCEKMEALAGENYTSIKDWNAKTVEAEELMKIWKNVGRAPEKQNDQIWERFRAAMNNFYEAKKNYFRSLMEEKKRNYEQKFDLAVKAELIAQQREDWRKATSEIKELQRQWKEIGPVPEKQSEKIWKRFRTACDEFFNQKKTIFEQRQAGETENLEAKKALIEEVKALDPAADKDGFITTVKDIQRRWTEIGFVPVAEKENIYKQFRAEIDTKFALLGERPKRWIDTLESAETVSSKNMQTLLRRSQMLRSDIITWENNIGFLSRSKNADILREEFEAKIQKAKEELALMEAKLKMLHGNENKSENRSENKDRSEGNKSAVFNRPKRSLRKK
ncbi:MAG: DUF349 domain-containing protein [Bacteroidales bacterium]|nr:DUF349 domain-containing protein [Bacteroidales bacterium]